MTDPLVPVGVGQTEVPEEDRPELIPTYVATLGELYAAEEANIAEGTLGLAPTVEEILDDLFLRTLHRAMFDKVWKWAGKYRGRETNIGVASAEISARVRVLVDDAKTWIELATFPPDEIAMRFHHRLVHVHPFVNGNGRHGRFAADYLIVALGLARFTWGRDLEASTEDLRRRYRAALQRVDANSDDIEELLFFARS